MPLEGRVANGTTDFDVDERQPLLSGVPEAVPNGGPFPHDMQGKPDESPSLRIILPALMVCAFLAAFDLTVVAAIYPIMSPSAVEVDLILVALTLRARIGFLGLLSLTCSHKPHFSPYMEDFRIFSAESRV